MPECLGIRGKYDPYTFGDAANGLLAGNYLMKGQFGDAGLEAIGLLPFVPGMTKAVKESLVSRLIIAYTTLPEKWFKPVKEILEFSCLGY